MQQKKIKKTSKNKLLEIRKTRTSCPEELVTDRLNKLSEGHKQGHRGTSLLKKVVEQDRLLK